MSLHFSSIAFFILVHNSGEKLTIILSATSDTLRVDPVSVGAAIWAVRSAILKLQM